MRNSFCLTTADVTTTARQSPTSDESEGGCVDRHGKQVSERDWFHPEPCTLCLCRGGNASFCRTIICQLPTCERWERVEGECCRFR